MTWGLPGRCRRSKESGGWEVTVMATVPPPSAPAAGTPSVEVWSLPLGMEGRGAWALAPGLRAGTTQYLPEVHSLQVNLPSGGPDSPRQARWKAPQQGPSQSRRLPVFSHTWGQRCGEGHAAPCTHGSPRPGHTRGAAGVI